MDEVIQITKDIKAGNHKPIYFLMGEEPYYIDKLTEFIDKQLNSFSTCTFVTNPK